MKTDWIAVFRTGVHTDSKGNTRTWTESDLNNIVQKYDPSYHEAPIVIGHPKDDAPAYGWVKSLKHVGGVLFAKFRDIVPEFAEMVNKGLFKKRSVSLYPDGTLRHIGFLGALPPAVKGLPIFAFADNSGLMIEFSEPGHSEIKEEIDRLLEEEQFIEYVANLIIQEMKTAKSLPYDEAFIKVVNKNPDILKRFEDLETELIRKKITNGGVGGLLDILTNNKAKNENMSFSQAFTAIQIEYPELAWSYLKEMNQ